MQNKIGLLSAVRKYKNSTVDPFENFLTEAWRWILDDNHELCLCFLKKFSNRREIVGERIESVKSQDAHIDMWIRTNKGAFIFEHKIDNKFVLGQIDGYLEELRRRLAEGFPVECLGVTRNLREFNMENGSPITMICWREIAEWLKENRLGDEIQKNYIDLFINLLENEKLGMNQMIDLATLSRWEEIDDIVIELFRDLRLLCGAKLVQLCRGPFHNNDEEALNLGPVVRRGFGRIGLQSSRDVDWAPGLFFGVLVDWEDHGVAPLNHEKGPDLCLILSLDKRFHAKFKTDFQKSDEFKEILSAFKDLEGSLGSNFKLYNPTVEQSNPNKWHVLYLRASLKDVLEGTKNFHEQLSVFEKILNEILHKLEDSNAISTMRSRLEW